MERTLVGDRGCHRIVYLRELVARIGVREVVNFPVTAVQLAASLQRLDIDHLVVIGHNLVELVGIGGEVGTFAVGGCCQTAQVVIRELVAPLCGLVTRLPLHRADIAVVNSDVNSYDGSTMEKVKAIEAFSEDEKKTVFSIVDAFVGKKKLKDALSNVLTDVK